MKNLFEKINSAIKVLSQLGTISMRFNSFAFVVVLLFSGGAWGQIAVTVTGNTNTTPNLAASYTSMANFVTELNGVTAVSGSVTATLAAGSSETAPIKGFNISTSTANVFTTTNTLTIVKASGSATTINAGVGTEASPGASSDGMLYLSGMDGVTIDGLTFTDGNTASATVAMEFGIAFFKRSAGDGCNGNTIQNCTFNMQRISNGSGTAPMTDGSCAIQVLNSTPSAATSALTPTNGGTLATNGTNSNNKFYSNTINGGNAGIHLGGFAATLGVGPTPTATTFLGDLGNDVGGTGVSGATTGNSILNFGGGAITSPSAGIRANNQWSLNISNNTVNNNNGSGTNHATTLRGIYLQAGTSANVTCTYNTVTIKGGGTTSTVTAIDNAIGGTAASNTVNINSNTIRFSYTTATSGVFTAISNSATAAAVNINNNNIQQLASTNYPSSGTVPVIVGGSPGGTLDINNNTISNFNMTGASGTLRAITASTPTGQYTVTGNTIENLTYSLITSSGSITGIYNLASAALQNINNNIIRNFSTPTTGTLNGIQNNTTTGTFNVKGNTISNFTTSTGGAGGFSANGIVWMNATVDISGNTIFNINSTGTTGGTGGTINGISVAGTCTVYNNKIYDLNSNSSNPVITGIVVSGTTNNVYNNLIGNITTPAANGAHPVIGMNLSSGTSNASFNTIYIAGTSSAGLFGTSGIFFSSSATAITLRSNLVVNLSTPKGTGNAAALRRSGGTAATIPANYTTTSNNNMFYAGTPGANNLIYTEGTTTFTNSQQTMAGYKTFMSTRDQASVSENISFQSTTGSSDDFLKYNTSIAYQSESGGITVSGITTDYFGTTRNVSTPDMGAWELNGTAADFTGPSISYTALSNTLCTNQSLTATTTDASGVNTTAGTKPRIYFKKSTDANTYVGNTSADNGWKFVESSSSASPFSFTIDASLLQSSLAAADVIQYFVVAQDLATVPNIGVNSGTFAAAPSSVALTSAAFALTGTINSYTFNTPIPTSVTIGAAGTYTSITGVGGLFAAINAGGLSGNTVATIIDASVTETGATALNQISYGCTPNVTLTIKPQTTATLTGSVASGALIKLNGADYVTIDGSNSGGTDRNLTITNTETTAPSVISNTSLGAGLGATNNTFKNCNINTGVQTTTGYGIAIGGSTPGTSGADNDNITIQNNNITACAVGIYAIGTAAVTAGGDDNLNISDNSVIYNSTLATIAIKIGQTLNSTVTNNTVNVETTTAVGAAGISLETGTNLTSVSKNLISKVKSTNSSSSSIARGIVVGTAQTGSVITISNNVIYNVLTAYPSVTVGYGHAGIMLGAIGSSGTVTTVTGGVSLYFNSVYLSGNSDRSAIVPTYALFVGSGVTSVDCRNNIFQNSTVNINSGGTLSKAYSIYSVAANTSYTTIDFNDYYVSGSQGVLGYLTSDRTDLAGIQVGFGQNVNSLVADPIFNSNTNLSPQPGSPVFGAGTAIGGITIDYLGTTRNNPPTIGAYETAVDVALPVITYTALSGTCLTTNITLTATITDASGVPTAGVLMPRIYYKKDAGAWFSSQGVLSSGTATNGTWTFTIVAADMGGVANPNVISYYVIAQDVAAISNITSNPSAGLVATDVNTVSTAPTTPNTYTIQNTLAAGTYTVGAGQTYTTLTAAVAAYNTSCLGGAIVFSLMDASYAGETFPITINANADASATNTLTIKPASGVTASISGTSAVAIFKLNGADYVKIDGSNSGGTDKNLTISNTNTGTSSAVVWLGSASVSNGATNNTIINCIITGNAPTTTLVGIISSSGTTIGAAAEIANANNTYNNNTVNTAFYGIAVVGPTGNESGTVISDNLIGSATVGNKIGLVGILVNNQSGVSVTNNTIFGANTSTTSTASGIYVYGTLSGGTISGNIISDIKNTNNGGYLANGILLASTSTTAAISVYNNFIYDIAAYGYSSSVGDNGYGIVLYSGGGYNLYNNTINMNTNQTLTTSFSSAIYIYSTMVTASSVNIRNNIFANTQTGGVPVANRYAIYSDAANTIFGTIDHNDYYTSGTHLGYRGSNRTTLANIVTGFGGNANSLNVAPTFTSATDLHLTSANAALKAGTFISSVLTDYDGDTRNVLTPSMGADEIYVANLWTGTSSTAFATAGNWDDNAVPSSGANITIPTGVTNNPVLASDKTIGTLALGSGTTLSIGSNTLTINGAVSGTGTLTGSSTSNLVVTGTSGTLYFNQTTAGTTNVLKNLTISGSGTTTLANTLNIIAGLNPGIVSVATGVTLATGGNLILKSDANGTASIANSAGTITGNITVERYIPALRKFRFLASPVVGATSANWRNNGTNTAGIGTHITGGTVGNNFDQSTTNAASAFGYNELLAGSDVTVGSGATSDPGWTAFANGNTEALTNGIGFRILIRGDRTISLTGGNATANNTTLSVTGTYPANSVSIATTKTTNNTNSGFNLVGNPYPATIDWNTVTKGADISTTYTTYNPSSGAYVSWNGTTGDASQYIASSQAFFVQQTGVAGGITIAEANKVSNAAGNYFRNKLADHLKISMKYDSANYDAAYIHFRSDAQNDFDTYDGLKFQNAGVNIASVGTDGKRYNINSLASLNQTTEIPLSVLGSVLTNFELKFDDVQTFKNHELYLIDNYLNKMLALSDGFTYPIELSSDSASVKDGRFKIVFVQKATGIQNNNKNANAFILYPNPAANSIHLLLDAKNTNNENVSFEIYNQLGARLQQGSLDFTTAKDQTIAIDQLAQGSYFIKLQSNSIQQTIKFIK